MRRRRLSPTSPIRAAFEEAATCVELAKEALLPAVPSARAPAVPLAEALLRFREALQEAEARMGPWRTPQTEAAWKACAEGLSAARAGEERVRLSTGPLPHDQLLFTLQDLIKPLEPFGETAAILASGAADDW
jgi:hypothetical protein